MNTLTIEKLSQKTLTPLLTMVMKFWPDTSFEGEYQYFTGVITRSNEECFLAHSANEYIGFIHVSLRVDYVPGANSFPIPFIEGIFVEEPFRHQGVASQMLLYVENWARKNGFSQVASDSELQNVSSLKFHEKAGFEEVDRTVNFIKNL